MKIIKQSNVKKDGINPPPITPRPVIDIKPRSINKTK